MKLTDTQRRQILNGEYPHIPLSVEEAAEFDGGEQIVLKPFQVWVTTLGVGKTKDKSLYLRYMVRDDRPRFVRRNPHGMDAAAIRRSLDAYGVPRQVSEQDAEEAAEASHYTSSHHQAVAGEAEEAVPVEYQNVLTMRSRRTSAEREQTERLERLHRQRVRSLNRALTDLVVRAAHQGVDATPIFAALEREIAALSDEVDDAA